MITDPPYDMDCPFCGQEIPAEDFVFEDEDGGWCAICFRCDREVMQDDG